MSASMCGLITHGHFQRVLFANRLSWNYHNFFRLTHVDITLGGVRWKVRGLMASVLITHFFPCLYSLVFFPKSTRLRSKWSALLSLHHLAAGWSLTVAWHPTNIYWILMHVTFLWAHRFLRPCFLIYKRHFFSSLERKHRGNRISEEAEGDACWDASTLPVNSKW